MKTFGEGSDYFFKRQIIWSLIAVSIFFLFSLIDWRFLKKGEILVGLFLICIFLLLGLLILGIKTRGATSWYKTTLFSLGPTEPVKLILIFILAKYFSRRHVEIADIRHILISGFYAAVPFVLIFFQPDMGSAAIIFLIWLGMILVSGVNKKHLFLLFLIVALAFLVSWFFVFKPYQKARIITFLNPVHDIRGAGYNAMQSMIAIGSGQIFGKGLGYGSQSRLGFLPEYQTDFIFSAFAEEWGFIGALFVFIFYGIILWRIIKTAATGRSNFETLFGLGMAIFLTSHFVINVGMNIGLLPITGVSLPFMSYGGSNLITIFAGLGILMSMRRYGLSSHPEDMMVEFLGM